MTELENELTKKLADFTESTGEIDSQLMHPKSAFAIKAMLEYAQKGTSHALPPLELAGGSATARGGLLVD
jgi:hypothetical protein